MAHAWSREKEEYLNYKLKKETIKGLAESECAGLGKRFSWHEASIEEGSSAKEQLNNLAKTIDATISVVGYHGRKGPKDDPTVMGSAVQYLSLETHKPVLIIKDPKVQQERPKGYRFAVCIDGSNKSLGALRLACEMKMAEDKISVVTCEQANIDTAKIVATVKHQLDEMGCLECADFQVLRSEKGRKAADIIRDHLVSTSSEETYVDVVFIGNRGSDFSSNDKNKYLGSVANQVIRNTKLNSLFIP